MAAELDLYSRTVIGWSMSMAINSRLVVDALEMAVQRQRPPTGLIVLSDRSVQYASEHYQRTLARYGLFCSMSRKANCWDNAPMESFFAEAAHRLMRYDDRSKALTTSLIDRGKRKSVVVAAVANRWVRWLHHEMGSVEQTA